MIKQQIILGDKQWKILVYYNISSKYVDEVINDLKDLKMSRYEISNSIDTLLNKTNTGMTYTNFEYHTTIVCISKSTSNDQFINTIIHEAKHVQSHICEYYSINEESEQAAYLIGYIVQQMYRVFKNMLI